MVYLKAQTVDTRDRMFAYMAYLIAVTVESMHQTLAYMACLKAIMVDNKHHFCAYITCLNSLVVYINDLCFPSFGILQRRLPSFSRTDQSSYGP